MAKFSEIKYSVSAFCYSLDAHYKVLIFQKFTPNLWRWQSFWGGTALEPFFNVLTIILQQIQLTFVELNLEADHNCTFDFVQIYDGPIPSFPPLGQRFCGHVRKDVPLSSTNQVFIFYHTDNSIGKDPDFNGTGFRLAWYQKGKLLIAVIY